MDKKKIFIAGHLGMVGSALVRKLKKENLILISHKHLDLTNQSNEKPVQI